VCFLQADRDRPDEETAVRRAKKQHFANSHASSVLALFS
jgi:hypothetical protein